MHALEHLHDLERQQAQRDAMRLAGGAALLLTAAPIFRWLLTSLFARLQPDRARNEAATLDALMTSITLAMVLFSLLIAFLTRRQSRADTIEQFIDAGTHPSAGGNDNPLVRMFVCLFMIAMTMGASLMFEALSNGRLRRRLAGVDRYRAAEILAALRDRPAGLNPRLFLRHGEHPLALRQTIGYLMTIRLAELAPQDGHLVQISPARRRLLGDFAGAWGPR